MHALLPLLAALATAEPTAEVADSGAVVATVRLESSPADVLGRLADPLWIAVIDGGTTTVEVVSRQADCLILDFAAPSPIGIVNYRVLRCPVVDGYEATLLQSDTFVSYVQRWTVLPSGDGSVLSYETKLKTRMMVPQYFVNQSTKTAVLSLMTNMETAFD